MTKQIIKHVSVMVYSMHALLLPLHENTPQEVIEKDLMEHLTHNLFQGKREKNRRFDAPF